MRGTRGGGGAGGGAAGGAILGGATLQNSAAELQIQHKVGNNTTNDFILRTIFRDLVTIPKADEAHTDLRLAVTIKMPKV